MWVPAGVDSLLFDTQLRSNHRVTARVELWSNGVQQTAAAPFTDGTVTDQLGTDNLGIGVRRSITLTVPPTPQWGRWLQLPGLELRPWRGVVFGDPTTTVECPLGRYPIRVPEQERPVTAITIKADDYYSRIIDANLTWPVQAPGGALVCDNIAWLFTTIGIPQPSVIATSNAVSPDGVWFTKTRHDAVVDLASSIAAEVFLSRLGVPTIADARTVDTSQPGSLVGLAEGYKRTPLWDKVYNVVAASTTMQGVKFDPARAGITWSDHPAAPQNLGSADIPAYRVYNYSSPLLADYDQALTAAVALLARVSSLAETYSFTGIPDPRIDAGDSVVIPRVDGGWKVAQVSSVTHPLTVNGKQTVTTIAANVHGATDLVDPPMWAPGHTALPISTSFAVTAAFTGTTTLTVDAH